VSEKPAPLYPFSGIGDGNTINGLNQNETGYRLLVEKVNDAIFILVDGFIVFHNRKTELLTGHSEKELSQTPFINFVKPEDRSIISKEIMKTNEGTHSFRIIAKSGEELWCQAAFVRIPWNQKPGILLSVRDLTPQKVLEEQLQQAQKMEALGTLVAGVAHEINNPTNLIMYNMPLLQKVWVDLLPILREGSQKNSAKKYGGLTYDFLKDNLHRLLSDIDMAANRIAKIISDLKNFSKQADVTEKEPMDINSAVENALRLAQSTLRKSRIKLTLELAEDLPHIEGNVHSKIMAEV